MKLIAIVSILAAASLAGAQPKAVFAGSDTLAGAITDAIIGSGMDQSIQYIGGGSGNAEKGIVNGDQGLGPMSRPMKPEVVAQLQAQGIEVTAHEIALDGLSMFVKKDSPLASLDLQTILRIYTCEFTSWEQIPGSGLKGPIKPYRRDNVSGTTDAFKHFTGLKNFGPCVVEVKETADIAELTSRDVLAIGYAGLSGKIEGNRSVAIASKPGVSAVIPTTQTIRNFSYPMARYLYVYEVSGARQPSDIEAELLGYLTDRSFMDPIVQAHEFITLD